MKNQREVFDEVEDAMVRPALDLFVVGARRILHRNTKGRLDISFVSHWNKQRYAVVLSTPSSEHPTLLVITVEARDGHKRKTLGGFYTSTESNMLKDSSNWIEVRILKHMGWKIEWSREGKHMKSEFPKGLYQ